MQKPRPTQGYVLAEICVWLESHYDYYLVMFEKEHIWRLGDGIYVHYNIDNLIFLAQNSFPMREWHLEHIEKIIVKFVTGLSANASRWEKRQHSRYGTLTNVCRQIEYDVKHGVTNEQVLLLLQKIRSHPSFSSILLNNDGSIERLNEIERHFTPHKEKDCWF